MIYLRLVLAFNTRPIQVRKKNIANIPLERAEKGYVPKENEETAGN